MIHAIGKQSRIYFLKLVSKKKLQSYDTNYPIQVTIQIFSFDEIYSSNSKDT